MGALTKAQRQAKYYQDNKIDPAKVTQEQVAAFEAADKAAQDAANPAAAAAAAARAAEDAKKQQESGAKQMEDIKAGRSMADMIMAAPTQAEGDTYEQTMLKQLRELHPGVSDEELIKKIPKKNPTLTETITSQGQ